MGKLNHLSASELRRLIGAKEISPVELLADCLTRMDKINPAVNAICARDNKAALSAAKAAEKAVLAGDELGALHGLPVGVKDLEETAGLLTTFGSQQYRRHVPKADGAVVARIRAAGAIIAAKTNTPEFGAGANTVNEVWGATRNAFDARLTAAGSSGGSAVALATDMLPLATGSDMGGSLRTPAAYNGIVGFRPSPGLVPGAARALGWLSIGVLGPMARNVRDLALLLSVQAGLHDYEPLGAAVDGSAFAKLLPSDLSRLKVAYTEDFGQCAVSKAVRKTFRAKITAIKPLFRSCDEIKPVLGDSHRVFDVLRATHFLNQHKATYQRDPSLLGPHVLANVEYALSLSFADSCAAQNEQTRHFRLFQDLYKEYDLVLAPMAAVPPRPWREPAVMEIDGKTLDIYYRWLALSYVVTTASNPALCLPAGTDENGLPFGLQLVGRFRGDQALLSAGLAMEAAMMGIKHVQRPIPSEASLAKARPELKDPVTHPPLAARAKSARSAA